MEEPDVMNNYLGRTQIEPISVAYHHLQSKKIPYRQIWNFEKG
jgi:hypothetical protein